MKILRNPLANPRAGGHFPPMLIPLHLSASIESLEARIAPATLDIINSVLTYTADAGQSNNIALFFKSANGDFDNVFLFRDGPNITIGANAANAGFIHPNGINSDVQGPAAFFNSIVINAGDLDDTLFIDSLTKPITANLGQAGDGNDSITVNTFGSPSAIAVAGSINLAAETITIQRTISVTNISLTTDALDLQQTITARGSLSIAPLTANRPLDLGTETAGRLSLTAPEIGRLSAPLIKLGSASAGSIFVDAALNFGSNAVSLLTGGGITEAGTGTIAASALGIDAKDTVTLDGGNNVNTLAGKVTGSGANFSYTDVNGFQIGTVDGITGLTAPKGNASSSFIALRMINGGNLTTTNQAAGAAITADALVVNGSGAVNYFTLTEATNNVTTLAGQFYVLSYTDADALTVGTVNGISGLESATGGVALTTLAGNLTVSNTQTGPGSSDIYAAGSIALTAGSAGSDYAINLNTDANIYGNNITLQADHLSIGASVQATTGITLQPFEAATAIALGGADDVATLGLSDAEIDLLNYSKIVIGDSARTSPVTLTGLVAPAIATNLELFGSSFTGTGGVSFAGPLTIHAKGNIALNGANSVSALTLDEDASVAQGTSVAFTNDRTFTAKGAIALPGFGQTTLTATGAVVSLDAAATLAFDLAGSTPGTDQDQLVVKDGLSLGNAAVTFNATTKLTGGAQLILVDNQGTDAITDTFADLPEGSVVDLGNGQAGRISYGIGNGDDVTLTVLSNDLQFSADHKTAVFGDVDGDFVTVKTTKGAFDANNFTLKTTDDFRQLFQALTLDSAFKGANITITAKANQGGGNGFVNLCFLDAAGVDLGTVSIAGDLGRINVGTATGSPDDAARTPALKALTVESLGLLGTSNQPPGGTLTSLVQGAVGKLTVKGDLRASVTLVGATDAILGSATIGGSIAPALPNTSTVISAEAGIGSIKIAGDIRASDTATVTITSTAGPIGSITVGGSILGSNAQPISLSAYGQLVAPTKGTDLAIKSVSVTGSAEQLNIVAGNTTATNADASIGKVSVGGDWIASDVLAGVQPGTDGKYGTADDAKLASGSTRDHADIISSIGSFTVKGQALGSSFTLDMFGVVAESIGKAQVGAAKFAFTKGATPEAFFAAPTVDGAGTEDPAFDFTIRELGSTTPTVTLTTNLQISTDSKTATFTDADGDFVTVKRTSGSFVTADFFFIPVPSGGGQLAILSLSAAPNDALFNVTVTAKPGPDGGNGFVNIDTINQDNAALVGSVSVPGDVTFFQSVGSAGTEQHTKSLNFHSLGQLNGPAVVSVTGPLDSLTIGADAHNAEIRLQGAGANLKTLTVGGSYLAKSNGLGAINVGGTIGTMKIGGSFLSGAGTGSGTITAAAIGSVAIGGDLIGTAAVPVEILAIGQANLTAAAKIDLAIGSLTVKGGVENALINAGNSQNSDASIGAISVGRAWLASSVAAGVGAGTDGFLGTSDDTRVGAIATDRIASIAKVLIKGQALGSTASGDTFGIVAEQIGAAQIGGAKFKFAKGANSSSDVFASAPTGPGATGLASDFYIRELTL